MRPISFAKMQATGNDFVLISDDGTDRNWAELARAMCHRHFGVGADGLLLVAHSQTADCSMRMFNPDGSEAEACGNGTRCVAKYVLDKGLVGEPRSELTIETIAGMRHVEPEVTNEKISQLKVGMGTPLFRPEEIPLSTDPQFEATPVMDYPLSVGERELALTFVSMGNPHAVYFTQAPVIQFPLADIGPRVEYHPLFPQRANFELAKVLGRGEIEMRVWERGAGETLSCGSGACAVAVAAQLHNYVDTKVDIILPGGTLTIEWDGAGDVTLSGPVDTVFAGEWITRGE